VDICGGLGRSRLGVSWVAQAHETGDITVLAPFLPTQSKAAQKRVLDRNGKNNKNKGTNVDEEEEDSSSSSDSDESDGNGGQVEKKKTTGKRKSSYSKKAAGFFLKIFEAQHYLQRKQAFFGCKPWIPGSSLQCLR